MIFLTRWIILAVLAGIIGSVTVHTFSFLLELIQNLLTSSKIPTSAWLVVGAAFVGGVIYRIKPSSASESIPLYIRGLRVDQGKFDLSETFFKFWAALLTLSTFGNGGFVGPLGRISSGIMSYIEGQINSLQFVFVKKDQRTAAICGFAAAIGAIFHSSIGAGIFAVEIIQRKNMGYRDLFPSILASTASVFFCKTIGWQSIYQFRAVDEFMDVRKIGWLLILAILTGITSIFYAQFYSMISRIFKRNKGNVLLKVISGSLLAYMIAWIVNPELLGTSYNIIDTLFTNDFSVVIGKLSALPFVPVIIIMLLLKIICNCLTVGSGMSAGFTGPTVIVGMLLGVTVADIANVEFLSPTYYAFLAAGFSGMLASVMNVPLAAAIMAVELFGLQYSFPAGFAAVLGFQVTRHKMIYDYALREFNIEG